MSRKINASLIGHAASLISSGILLKDAAKEIGIHTGTLSRKLKEIGFIVPHGRGGPKKINLPLDKIKTMYKNGHSENGISKHFGVDRGTIRKRLLNAGISPRTKGEAEKLKWIQMDEKSRKNQVKNAHNAIRGVPRSSKSKALLARTRQKLKYDHLIGFGEIEFRDFLSKHGINFIHQKAVKGYNLDFAIGNIAVELSADCGRYSMFNPKELRRAEKLLECGYHVVAVEFDSIESMLMCAKDILSYIDLASSLKSSSREYWVIRCRMKDHSIVKNKFGQFTRIEAPVNFFTKRTIVDLD